MAGQHGSYSSSAAQVAMLMPSAPPKDTAAKNLRGADIAAGGHQKSSRARMPRNANEAERAEIHTASAAFSGSSNAASDNPLAAVCSAD